METKICALNDIPDGAARGFLVPGQSSAVSVLVTRAGGQVFAYENRCPHTGVNLDWVPGQFMDVDGVHLQCATHGALFRVRDGYCVYGPCAGQALARVPVQVRDGDVVLALTADFPGPGSDPGRQPG